MLLLSLLEFQAFAAVHFQVFDVQSVGRSVGGSFIALLFDEPTPLWQPTLFIGRCTASWQLQFAFGFSVLHSFSFAAFAAICYS